MQSLIAGFASCKARSLAAPAAYWLSPGPLACRVSHRLAESQPRSRSRSIFVSKVVRRLAGARKCRVTVTVTVTVLVGRPGSAETRTQVTQLAAAGRLDDGLPKLNFSRSWPIMLASAGIRRQNSVWRNSKAGPARPGRLPTAGPGRAAAAQRLPPQCRGYGDRNRSSSLREA